MFIKGVIVASFLFHYGDQVIFKDPFYGSCKGEVTSVADNPRKKQHVYIIKATCNDNPNELYLDIEEPRLHRVE